MSLNWFSFDIFTFKLILAREKYLNAPNLVMDSRVAQWKRAGPITQRSVDRNYALLRTFFFEIEIFTSYAKLYF